MDFTEPTRRAVENCPVDRRGNSADDDGGALKYCQAQFATRSFGQVGLGRRMAREIVLTATCEIGPPNLQAPRILRRFAHPLAKGIVHAFQKLPNCRVCVSLGIQPHRQRQFGRCVQSVLVITHWRGRSRRKCSREHIDARRDGVWPHGTVDDAFRNGRIHGRAVSSLCQSEL